MPEPRVDSGGRIKDKAEALEDELATVDAEGALHPLAWEDECQFTAVSPVAPAELLRLGWMYSFVDEGMVFDLRKRDQRNERLDAGRGKA